jgi:hypothetical protein
VYSATNTGAGIHWAAVGVVIVDFYIYLAFLGEMLVVVEWP